LMRKSSISLPALATSKIPPQRSQTVFETIELLDCHIIPEVKL
jgi:hypothetical protein